MNPTNGKLNTYTHHTGTNGLTSTDKGEVTFTSHGTQNKQTDIDTDGQKVQKTISTIINNNGETISKTTLTNSKGKTITST